VPLFAIALRAQKPAQQNLPIIKALGLHGEFVRKIYYSGFCALLLSACATTNESLPKEYIDLVGNKEAVLDYWIVDKKVAPKYPLLAAKKRMSGCVEFLLVIDSNGKALKPKIIKEFPEGVFGVPAYKAIKKWSWKPTVSNTNKKPVSTTVQLDFVVKDSPNGKNAYKACKI
jgi:hypothetical protein